MEVNRKVGDIYRQEFSMGTSEDFGSILSLNKTVTVSTGTYTNCVETLDGSTLEPTTPEHKYYAQGVGDVLEIDLATGQRTELRPDHHQVARFRIGPGSPVFARTVRQVRRGP